MSVGWEAVDDFAAARFREGLAFFGRAGLALRAKGYEAPVLVGGAAIELFSNNLIATGDFDIATARQQAFEEELVAGLQKADGGGSCDPGLDA